jgi:hypothetical protein
MENRMEAAFLHVDEDGSGLLSVDEMMVALNKMGWPKQREGDHTPIDKLRADLREQVADKAGDDGELNLVEFKELVNSLMEDLQPKDKWAVRVQLPFGHEARHLYESHLVTYGVAVTIVLNFLIIIVQNDIDPYQPELRRHQDFWKAVDSTCNVIFLFELLLNLYANFWRPFVSGPWNYLDAAVVIVGVLSLAEVELGPLASLKMLRALRIVRLFKRIESLNWLITSLVAAIPGVLNAFAVMTIFMAVFAILAVDLFRDFGQNGFYSTTQMHGPGVASWLNATVDSRYHATTRVESITARGFHHGQEYFGCFSRSTYTLFQARALLRRSLQHSALTPRYSLMHAHPPRRRLF